jgi:hypothetical protein
MKKFAFIFSLLLLVAPAFAEEADTTQATSPSTEGAATTETTPATDQTIVEGEPAPTGGKDDGTQIKLEQPGADVLNNDQEIETLFHQTPKITLGYYGGLVMKESKIKGNWALLLGGKGALLVNHSLGVGGAFWISTETVQQSAEINLPDLLFMYGGPMLEYCFFSRKLVHFSANAVIGWGALTDEGFHHYHYWYDGHTLDNFFVLEPGVDVELNLFKFCRVGLGASYRYIRGVELMDMSNRDFSGVNAELTIMFGRY